MQPRVAVALGAERQQRVTGVRTPTTGNATLRLRPLEIAIQPLADARLKSISLRLDPRQTVIELGDARGLVEEGVPILAIPSDLASWLYRWRMLLGQCQQPVAVRAGSTNQRWRQTMPTGLISLSW
jgi:hypothetical protein